MFADLRTLPSFIARYGLRTGFRFWRIGVRAHYNPEVLIHWADRCQSEASNHFKHGETVEAHKLLRWAETLRTTYAKQTGRKPRRPLLEADLRRTAKTVRKLKLKRHA